MRRLLATAVLLGAVAVSAALAAPSRMISTAGVRVAIPAGWHAVVSRTPNCDPERLIVASSAPVRLGADGRVAAPRDRDVLVLLLEDRAVQDRPTGDLRRPSHFSVRWDGLTRVKAVCGLPNAPAFMRYFKSHGRYLGFIVYPGVRVGPAARAKTLALMDSLHLGA